MERRDVNSDSFHLHGEKGVDFVVDVVQVNSIVSPPLVVAVVYVVVDLGLWVYHGERMGGEMMKTNLKPTLGRLFKLRPRLNSFC